MDPNIDIDQLDRDINAVIMDYLLSEGYPDAAQQFASEANIDPQPSTETIEARVSIRNAILAGNIEAAIESINDVNPEVRRAELTMIPTPCYDYLIFMHHS
jgi:glucose-induced degradation protein 8